MKYLSIILCALLMTGCASTPNKEYEYIYESGELATPEEVAKVKEKCDYEKKIQASKDNLGTAISIGRYENEYGPKKSDKYVEEAARLMSEAKNCLIQNGLRTREKGKP